ncbi:alpha/beta hydrolase fold protein [Kribbella flavida DSM 17836]|uniref:Alpha/beta hydrolase fold protein n=1 Tax=Kribbella flavida (strain DSM 17836 / JCM 10339 / NBRC 14399) TaxID=479435 RepID=D2PZL2_KRIFD|nr:alpha/beta hydrolase [Kribbella flavida]ADB35578.1 alpha/beta hydrolase fold protein [Kribbella flavida DSM 17836]
MPTFSTYDGTELAYHLLGDSPGDAPIVCVPGGPMQASAYLGDLGGLATHCPLIQLDLRGTGDSAIPADPTSYRCDRQVGDVEALRRHLGLESLNLLAHSGGTNLAVQYAARHPEHVAKLALISPSAFGVGLTITGEQRLAAARLRADEPWFPTAYAALQEIVAGNFAPDHWQAIAPLSHGRWDDAAQAMEAAGATQKNDEAAGIYGSDDAFTPEATRTALAAFPHPVLVLAGRTDVGVPAPVATEYAALFPHSTLTIQPASGHFPWLDDPRSFTTTVSAFFA